MRLKTLFAGVTSVLVVIILFLSYQLYVEKSEDADRERVSFVAREFVTHLTTYSHDTIDKDLEKVLADSTGNFKKDYEKALGGKSFRDALTKVEGKSEGKVVAVIVDALGRDKAAVAVIVEQTTTNNELTEPRVETNRVQLSMVKVGDEWKIDEVTSVSPL